MHTSFFLCSPKLYMGMINSGIIKTIEMGFCITESVYIDFIFSAHALL